MITAAGLAAGLLLSTISADAGTLIPVPPVSGSTGTFIGGINDKNQITGDYTTSDGNLHGFVGTLDGQYTSFDFPGGQTSVSRIDNKGFITGLGNTQTEDCQTFGCQYLRDPDGTVEGITKAGVPLDGIPEGIIGHARYVGQYSYYDGTILWFYGYYGRGTKYRSDLSLPFNTQRTSPRGYRKDGTVVGYFRDIDHGNESTGFILQNGIATAVNYPDPSAFYTFLEDVNDSGIVSGYWLSSDQQTSQAFLYDLNSQTFSPIEFDGASSVYIRAINRHDVVAVEIDNAPYIYCTNDRKCPLSPSRGVKIAVKSIPATPSSVRSVTCKNGCTGPSHANGMAADPAAVRAAIAQDPDLDRPVHLAYRR
jgi:hypothetical protein